MSVVGIVRCPAQTAFAEKQKTPSGLLKTEN
jgi:hypothetical protein